MKSLFTPLLGVLSLALFAIPGRGQLTVSYVGTTTGSTMPGSASDFIFFNGSNYPGYPTYDHNIDNGTASSQLTSFSISGGVDGYNGSGSYASIITPAGGSPILTGDIQAAPGIAFALEPGLNANSDLGTEDTNLNSNFNYNDFNVYLMISNTGGTFTDAKVSIDGREFNGPVNPAFGTNDVSVTDNSTTSTTAEFIEFNVTGLGTAIADGYKPDLVVSANLPSGGNISYIGGVSFESVPEPSTYAMVIGGLALLGFCLRRKASQLS